jgi:hypothetical protein
MVRLSLMKRERQSQAQGPELHARTSLRSALKPPPPNSDAIFFILFALRPILRAIPKGMNRKDQIAGKLDAYFHEKSMSLFPEGSAYSDFAGRGTWWPARPLRSIACWMRPDALAVSINSQI